MSSSSGMLETARDQGFPKIQQISFFLPNKVGSLQRVLQVLEQAHVQMCGLSILDAHDHAVVRIIVDRPGEAIDTLGSGGRSVCTTLLLGVELPEEPNAVSRLLATLLRAELNVYYAYTLLVRPHGKAVLALHVDNRETASQVLRKGGFTMVDQQDLEQPV